jgi:outer membrane protein TolC
VAAAERRVAAANARIGVTRAAFFPGLQFGGRGRNGEFFPRQLDAGAKPLLVDRATGRAHAFRRRSAPSPVGRRCGAYDEQVANYRASVLTAFQEVEDNLAALRQLERESLSQAAAVAATQGALDQANFRYRSGLVTYLEVVSTENAALAARITAIDIDARRLTASCQRPARYRKALGGDWNRATS